MAVLISKSRYMAGVQHLSRTVPVLQGRAQQALEKIEQIDAADLVVGILANLDQETVATVHEALRTLHGD